MSLLSQRASPYSLNSNEILDPNEEGPKMINLEKGAFDIEHALSMYAISYATLPAAGLYYEDGLASIRHVSQKCHIYLIGYTPQIEAGELKESDRNLTIELSTHHAKEEVSIPLLEHHKLVDSKRGITQNTQTGQIFEIDKHELLFEFSRKVQLDFQIAYIGQAYGMNGERNAIDRLSRHETLQKISLKGRPPNTDITIILVEILPATRMLTVINPFAKNKDEEGTRIKAGVEKLFGTTEAERICLYEAALIRYFRPEFNTEFKDSFPSTNLKILKNCYEKDFSAVIAEFVFDRFPWHLGSKVVAPSRTHYVRHSLHTQEDRDLFFV